MNLNTVLVGSRDGSDWDLNVAGLDFLFFFAFSFFFCFVFLFSILLVFFPSICSPWKEGASLILFFFFFCFFFPRVKRA